MTVLYSNCTEIILPVGCPLPKLSNNCYSILIINILQSLVFVILLVILCIYQKRHSVNNENEQA